MDHPDNNLQDQNFNSAGVLIVDDNPESRSALVEILATSNYRLVEAESTQEALNRLRSDEFAVLLIDVAMKQISGLELASVTSAIPIIFLTTESVDVKQIYRCHKMGAVDYLVRPLIPEVVRAKVAILVELFVQKKDRRRMLEMVACLKGDLK